MTFTIIEDCSPYYIKFTYPGIENVSKYCRENYIYDQLPDMVTGDTYHSITDRNYVLFKLSEDQGRELLNQIPLSTLLLFNPRNCSMFVSKPNCIEMPHKDGTETKCGINFGIDIQDDLCITNWYDDSQFEEYNKSNVGTISRIPLGYVEDRHIPAMSTVTKQNECILFNTDIYHNWDNRTSKNRRVLLTLRFKNVGKVYFNDVRKTLFGY